MPYISVANRYDSPSSAGVTQQLANLDKTMRRYEGASNNPAPVNRKRPADEALESFRHGHALPAKPPPSAAAEYGFERGRGFGGTAARNQAGRRGCRDDHEYQQYQERQRCQTPAAEEAYRQQERWQRSAYPDVRQGSYSYWQPGGPNVYPTAPAPEAWQYPQYAMSFQSFPVSQQFAQQAERNNQYGLTPWWHAANNTGPQSTAQLNANATAFQPQALPFRYADYKSSSIYPPYDQGGVSLQQKTPVAGFKEASTRHSNGTTKQTTGAAASTQSRTDRIKVPWMQRNVPRKHMMQRPNPTAEYLRQASNAPEELSSPRSLLVILDLNGTLLYREPPTRKHVIERPHMQNFLSYLLQHHAVMLWSSATPRSVDGMTAKIFDEASEAKLIDTWNRTHLRLPANAYNEKVQVYKQLAWVWENQTIQSKHPFRAAQTDPTASWNQADTVLIDDSIEKAASEPHNLIELEEFEAKDHQMGEDALGQVVTYLEKLRRQKDISAYMRLKPFAFDREASVDWESFFKDNES